MTIITNALIDNMLNRLIKAIDNNLNSKPLISKI